MSAFIEISEEGVTIHSDSARSADRTSRFVAWEDVSEVQALDPWPTVSLLVDAEWLEPEPDDASARELIASALAHGVPVARGWYDAPEVRPTKAERLPQGDERAGDYRSAGSLVLARRDRPTLAARWLARFCVGDDAVDEVVLTADAVWFSRRDGTSWRVSRAALRSRYARDGTDVYVFGLQTELALPRRIGCPVVAALEEQLSRTK